MIPFPGWLQMTGRSMCRSPQPKSTHRSHCALQAKNPQANPPRAVTGPILLTGLAHCASCGGAMPLRTGTSKNRNVYRYYTCSSAARIGKTGCRGRSIPMEKLDQLVTEHVADRILVPERLGALL